jgi:acetyl esterase/lipase
MECKFVDLYQNYSQNRPKNGAGFLQCWIQNPDGISCAGSLRPGVLLIPGGGYDHVSAREGEPVALRFLARGYQAFVLRYSVGPVGYPAALREAAMAMRYIREHAGEWGMDPHMVAVVGFSAGGHLSGLLATLFDDPAIADIGAPEILRPDGLGLSYPVAVSWGNTHEGSFRNLCGEDRDLRRRLSLDALVRPDMPPVFLWHTRDDASVPVRNSLLLAQALETAGVDFAMHIYRSGCHGLSTADCQVYPADQIPPHSPDVPGWIDAEIGFFEEIGIKCRSLEVE